MLNSREIATLIWLTVGVAIFVLVPNLRRSVGPPVRAMLRTLANYRVLRIFFLFLAWCALWVWLASLTGLWKPELLKDSVLVVAGVGFPLLFRAMRAKTGADIARQIRREALSLSVVFAFYLNFTPLPLWAELLLAPALAFFGMMVAFGTHDARGRPFVGCSSVFLVLIAVGLIVWTALQTVTNWTTLDLPSIALQLALSVWLPLVMFPFLYAVAFYAATESLLVRLKWLNKDMTRSARLGVFLGLRFSVRWVKALTGRYNYVAEATGFRDGLGKVRTFREDVARREVREQHRLDSLKVLAGEPGTDGSGAQLDRREFHGTKSALRWIHVTQSGQYEAQGNRFWNDLTDMMLRPLSRYDLPDDHGVVVETTANRQKWRAWRRLPSGWVLGIGATGPRGEYLYAAAKPPASWPSESEEWIDGAGESSPADWARDDGSHL